MLIKLQESTEYHLLEENQTYYIEYQSKYINFQIPIQVPKKDWYSLKIRILDDKYYFNVDRAEYVPKHLRRNNGYNMSLLSKK